MSLLIKIYMQIFITGWWLCPELYLRRPFQDHASSRLDTLLEAKAKEGVQVRKKIIIIKLQNYYALIITFNILQ
jgi:hypothetical protein